MNDKTHQLYFLIIFLAALSILVFFIFQPFLYTLLLAVTFAVVFFPVHEKILRFTGGRKSIASIITTLLVAIFILTPLAFLALQILQEAWQVYAFLAQNENGGLMAIAKDAIENLKTILPIPAEASSDLNQYLTQGLSWIIQHLGVFFSSVTQLALHTFLFVFSFYYILKDGSEIRKGIIAISPLADSDDEFIFQKLHSAINSVVRGNLLVALIQGGLAGIGFLVFGIPNPLLWSSVAVIAALIPAVGTAIITIPAVIFLAFIGSTAPAIGLLIWGVFVVGLIDNILRPKLVERGMEIHPLLILLSVLGGIVFFGPIGIILGPLTLSLFVALFQTYFSFVTKK